MNAFMRKTEKIEKSEQVEKVALCQRTVCRFVPTSNSGARYHLVATYAVTGSSSSFCMFLANPKSQSFKLFVPLSTKRFSGFISLWITLFWWHHSIAFKSWTNKLLTTLSDKPAGFASSRFNKLWSMYSKTKWILPRRLYWSWSCTTYSKFCSFRTCVLKWVTGDEIC